MGFTTKWRKLIQEIIGSACFSVKYQGNSYGTLVVLMESGKGIPFLPFYSLSWWNISPSSWTISVKREEPKQSQNMGQKLYIWYMQTIFLYLGMQMLRGKSSKGCVQAISYDDRTSGKWDEMYFWERLKLNVFLGKVAIRRRKFAQFWEYKKRSYLWNTLAFHY